MIYSYYAKIISDEHMLYSKELAQRFKLYSNSGNPHYQLVRKFIYDYIQEQNIKYIPLYYYGKNGLNEVYPKEIYIPAYNRFITLVEDYKYISLDGVKYNFKRKNE